MSKQHLTFAAMGVALLITGCGGGGSSSGSGGGGSSSGSGGSASNPYGTVPTAAVQITALNAPTVATTGAASVNSMGKAGSSGTKGMGKPASAVQRNGVGAANIADRTLRSLIGTRLTSLPSGAIQSRTVNCTVSGTTDMSFTDANNNSAFDNGDAVSVTFNACSDVSGETLDGGMSFTLNALTASSTVMNYSATIRFNNLVDTITGAGADTIRTTGDMTLALNMSMDTAGNTTAGTMSISGSAFYMDSTVDGTFQMADYNLGMDVVANTLTVTMTTSGTDLAGAGSGGSVTISTPTPISPTGGWEMRFTGASGGYVSLTSADGVTCSIGGVDSSGNAIPTTTQSCPQL